MESQSLTIDEIQQLKLELEKSIGQLLLAFSQRTSLRVIEIRPLPNQMSHDFRGVPEVYQTKVLTAYPFQ
jgi:hypothetical protein